VGLSNIVCGLTGSGYTGARARVALCQGHPPCRAHAPALAPAAKCCATRQPPPPANRRPAGSYIFSQTIFSMRAGVTSRAHGWLISGTELAVFLAPFAVAQYLPLYFYGSLLAVFGVEIAGDCASPVFSFVVMPTWEGGADVCESSLHS
jgi:hypothetical protein